MHRSRKQPEKIHITIIFPQRNTKHALFDPLNEDLNLTNAILANDTFEKNNNDNAITCHKESQMPPKLFFISYLLWFALGMKSLLIASLPQNLNPRYDHRTSACVRVKEMDNFHESPIALLCRHSPPGFRAPKVATILFMSLQMNNKRAKVAFCLFKDGEMQKSHHAGGRPSQGCSLLLTQAASACGSLTNFAIRGS